MTVIIGIAGKKQSGKNTSANFFHGKILKKINAIQDFKITDFGQLIVQTSNMSGEVGWGEFDVTRKDNDFVQYAEENMWPYVKLYNFADTLKWMCMELFNIPYQCVNGTDEQKNQVQEHLLWENMPRTEATIKNGPMTAREFMQLLGTNIMRKIYQGIWVENTIKRIKREKSSLAIIADVRFPNEVEAILKNGGSVIKLNRNSDTSSHESEKALDPENFDQSKFAAIIDNKSEISNLCNALDKFYQTL